MSDLLFFLRDGTPATEVEVYERGGFQLSLADARARGLEASPPAEAEPAQTKPVLVETKPVVAQTKPVRRAPRRSR